MISIHPASTVPEEDGIVVKRLMPVHGLRNYDPFVLCDHFDIAGGGFPDHPHRGFEAITYLFDGGMKHADNLGNQGTIHAGGAQRFTAGRGMVHSEFPDGRAHGIQLWINLPQRLKSIAPDYQQLQADQIAESHQDGISIRHIIGDAGIHLHTAVELLDVRMAAGQILQRQVVEGMRGFIYLVQGSLEMNAVKINSGQAAFIDFSDTQGVETLDIKSADAAHLIWCFGKPHHESIHQHGPYVD